MENDKLLSVKEVAQILGVNHQRVQALISQGRLPAQKIGNSYVIKESDLQLVEDRPTGRPPKDKSEK
ncbi:MAG: helix-turn-helix domain-containing protein [Pyrinomonadaceae bacterium]